MKRVTGAGTFRFQHRLLYIANALVDQWIGLKETDDGVWSLYFKAVLLATLDSGCSSAMVVARLLRERRPSARANRGADYFMTPMSATTTQFAGQPTGS
jgi:hypothetical protein